MGRLQQTLVNWLSIKQNPVARLMYVMTAGAPLWTPRDYANLAHEGYENCVTVYACVNAISRAAAGIRWGVFADSADGERKELPDHALAAVMRRPNPMQKSWATFLDSVFGYWLLAGNSYVTFVGPNSGPPKELWPLRPDRMKIKPDQQNVIAGYQYVVGGRTQDFDVSDVLHLKFFHPTNDWFGLSPLEVAARVVDSDNEAVKWNMSLLQNSARPSGALVSSMGLTDEQYNKLKGELDQQVAAPKNAGRPLLLEGGLDWKSMGLSPSDMDWLNGRKLTKREIAQAFGVPPELIGDSDSKTYSNYQEARAAFYMETVLPLCDRFRDDLNGEIEGRFPGRVKIDYDRDDIEALQEDQTAKWQRVENSTVLTINEKRAELGYEDVSDGDVILVASTLVPLEQAIEPPLPPPGVDEHGEPVPPTGAGASGAPGETPKDGEGDAA